MSDFAIQIPKRILAKYALNGCLWLASFLLVILLDTAANAGGTLAKLYGLVSMSSGLVAFHYEVWRLLGVKLRRADLLLVTISWVSFANFFGVILGGQMFESRSFDCLLMGVILLHFIGMLVYPIAPNLVVELNRWVDRMKL